MEILLTISAKENFHAERQTKVFSLFLLVVMTGTVLGCGFGCSRTPEKQHTENATNSARELEKLSGLKFPASARILSAIGEDARDGTKYKRWIVLSAERPMLAGSVIEGDNYKIFIETLKEAVPDENIGRPKGDRYQFSNWKNERGGWQAAVIETDKGFYLNLENIVLD